MAFKPFRINDGIVTDGAQGGSVHVEPGTYLFEIDSARPSPEDQEEGKNAYIDWYLKILDGPDGIGRRLRHMTVMSDKTMFHLGTVIHYAGKKTVAEFLRQKAQSIETRAQFENFVAALAKQLRGAKLAGTVADESYQGNPSSKVIEFIFAADYEAVSSDVAEVPDEVEEPDFDFGEAEEEEAPTPIRKAAPPQAKKPGASPKKPAAPAKSLEDELGEYFK